MFTLVFSGRLGDAPNFKYTAKAEPMCGLSVALSAGKDVPPLWIDVVLFGKAAETFAALKPAKGDLVSVRSTRTPKINIFERKAGGVGATLSLIGDWIEIEHRAIPSSEAK